MMTKAAVRICQNEGNKDKTSSIYVLVGVEESCQANGPVY